MPPTSTTLTFPMDPDAIPRAVVAGSSLAQASEWEIATHKHQKAQFLYVVRGVVNCEVADGLWLVPPHCAVWIPQNLPHAFWGAGESECYSLFFAPDEQARLPKRCCTLAVSALLRELVIAASGFSMQGAPSARETRLIATLLDELVIAPVEDLHLPMPQDARLRQLIDRLARDPDAKITKREWAQRIGMSERNLSRLLRDEVGMSFGGWRRQLHVMLALQRLSKGESVQAVAWQLGYENASGFVTMFRKAVGKPPARYLSERTRRPEAPAVSGTVLSSA